MRNWLFAMLVALFPNLGAQDNPAPASAPAPAKPEAADHAICGGDTAVPKTATLLPGYGKGGFPITTANARAQAFFDNGMQLGHAFAHKASIAAFHEASRLDPACAMCAWGEAWASGPTINYPIDAGEQKQVAVLAATAQRLAVNATPRERALIAALVLRYPAPGKDKQAGDIAFARAMQALAVQYPLDDEIQVIAADAIMIAASDKDHRRTMLPGLAMLETVLRRDPDYTPAIHFYIHYTETLDMPGRAEPYADRLAALAPAASHLIHMPSHTYYWVGRYQDAADANMRAVEIGKANAKRLGLDKPDGVWSLPYHAHNVTYGIGGALMAGDGRTALALGEPLVAVSAVRPAAPPFMQMMAALGYVAEARFADPAVTLALPQPKMPYLAAYWHYARGEAQARLGNAAGVRAEAAAIPDAIGKPVKVATDDNWGTKDATRMLHIARLVLTGRAAMLDNDPQAALTAYRKAAALQEGKEFRQIADPPAWWYPVRRSVAEALLATGDAKGALREADATLNARPRDPVTLAIRARARDALGAKAEAALDRRDALRIWHGASWAFQPALS